MSAEFCDHEVTLTKDGFSSAFEAQGAVANLIISTGCTTQGTTMNTEKGVSISATLTCDYRKYSWGETGGCLINKLRKLGIELHSNEAHDCALKNK